MEEKFNENKEAERATLEKEFISEPPAERTLQTRDLCLGAALLAWGFRAVEVELSYEGSRPAPVGHWTFSGLGDGGRNLAEAEADFLAGGSRVEPRRFHSAIKTLKGMASGRG